MCQHERTAPLYHAPDHRSSENAQMAWAVRHERHNHHRMLGCEDCGMVFLDACLLDHRALPGYMSRETREAARRWNCWLETQQGVGGDRRRIERLERLAERPGSEGEGAAARHHLDRLKGVAR